MIFPASHDIYDLSGLHKKHHNKASNLLLDYAELVYEHFLKRSLRAEFFVIF